MFGGLCGTETSWPIFKTRMLSVKTKVKRLTFRFENLFHKITDLQKLGECSNVWFRCFVGKRHLESAIDVMKQEAEFKVTWKPFFLNPSTPKEGIPLVDYISSRYGAEAGRKVAEGKSALFDVGKKLGITFTKDRRIVDTMKSHCMLEYARASEIQNKVAEALFRNYFEEGKDINADDILMQIAKDTSLEETGLKKCLNDSNLQNAVTEEVKVANRRGIHGVPFFDIFIAGLNDKNPMSLSRAQGPDVFLSIFKRLLNMLKSKA